MQGRIADAPQLNSHRLPIRKFSPPSRPVFSGSAIHVPDPIWAGEIPFSRSVWEQGFRGPTRAFLSDAGAFCSQAPSRPFLLVLVVHRSSSPIHRNRNPPPPRPAPTPEKNVDTWIRGVVYLPILPSNTPSSAPTPHNYNYNTCIYLASYVYTCVLSRTPNSMPLPLPVFTLPSLPNRTPSFSRVRITPPAHAASSNEPTTTR